MLQRILVFLLVVIAPGCSIKRVAINKLGNALASGGTSYERDEDPELVAAAVPFGLKLYESLLEESPRHTGLLLAACSGFTEYAYAFVDLPSSEMKETSLDRAEAMRERARKLYLRAHRYGLRALDTRYPGISKAMEDDAGAALVRAKKRDVAMLYWTAASLGLAISVSKDDPGMIGQLPFVEAIIRRASDLDSTWGNGSIPEFMITLEASRSGVKADLMQKAMRGWYEKSLAISNGTRAGTYVSLAENAAVPAQDGAEFKRLLEKALAIDPAANSDNRLANVIAQRRARWLLAHQGELILEKEAK